MREIDESDDALIDNCVAATHARNVPLADLTQQAWLVWCQCRERFDPAKGEWCDFVYVTVTRELRRYVAKYQCETRGSNENFDNLQCETQCDSLESVLETLPPSQRRAFEIVYLEGRTTGHAAKALRMRKSALLADLAAAETTVRETLECS